MVVWPRQLSRPRHETSRRTTSWVALITRIYKAFALVCPLHGGNMRLIAFITEGVQISRILEHIDVDTQAKG